MRAPRACQVPSLPRAASSVTFIPWVNPHSVGKGNNLNKATPVLPLGLVSLTQNRI